MRFIRFGVTVAEVLVAVVVLTVGVLALVGTWARTSRMIGLGRHSTVAALAASSRIEWLRQARARLQRRRAAGPAGAAGPPSVPGPASDGTSSIPPAPRGEFEWW